MVGIEALGLQGLPVDELLLTRETEDQLADLAGNAMSSTVVGSTIVAALIVSSKHLVKKDDDDAMDVDDITPGDLAEKAKIANDEASKAIHGVEALSQGTFDLAAAKQHTLKDVLAAATRSVRLCDCEGRDNVVQRTMLGCKDCGSTACEKCSGRPEHNYEVIDVVANPRTRPSVFRQLLKDQLPMSVTITGLDEKLVEEAVEASESSFKAIDRWCELAKGSTKSAFNFKEEKRQDTWVVVYESATAVLELHLNPLRPEWLLFARPPASEPANSRLRVILRQPIARLYCEGSLLVGNWEIGVPSYRITTITIEGAGQLVPSWEAKLGIEREDLKDKKVWSQLEITSSSSTNLGESIEGTYQLLDRCGTANSALHCRLDRDPSKPPTYLFLDPTRCGEPDEDSFVFSSSIRRIEFEECRTILGSLTNSWRPSSVEGAKKVEIMVPCHWHGALAVKLQVSGITH